MKFLADVIKRNEKLNFLRVCAQQSLTKGGRLRVANTLVYPGSLEVDQLGDENYGKTIYLVDPVLSISNGFFSIMNNLMAHLHFADRAGFYPVVNCENESLYGEPEPVDGTLNFFEYFFMQPMDISVPTALKSAALIRANKQQAWAFVKTVPTQSQTDVRAQLVKKYLRFNSKTHTYLQSESEKYIGGSKTLGVKYRGTDYFWQYANHPIPPAPQEFVGIVENVFKAGMYERIYLATEDEDALQLFLNTFGNLVVYDNAIVRHGKNVNQVDNVLNNFAAIEHPRYQAGLDVLKDVWVLANTQGFIGNRCNVTDYVIIFNKAYMNPFDYYQVLDFGDWGMTGNSSIAKNEKRHQQIINQHKKR